MRPVAAAIIRKIREVHGADGQDSERRDEKLKMELTSESLRKENKIMKTFTFIKQLLFD